MCMYQTPKLQQNLTDEKRNRQIRNYSWIPLSQLIERLDRLPVGYKRTQQSPKVSGTIQHL